MSVARDLTRRRLDEIRRGRDGLPDTDVIFDVVVDTLERPTSVMLAAGAAALAEATRGASGSDYFESRRVAGMLWYAMWQNIE